MCLCCSVFTNLETAQKDSGARTTGAKTAEETIKAEAEYYDSIRKILKEVYGEDEYNRQRLDIAMPIDLMQAAGEVGEKAKNAKAQEEELEGTIKTLNEQHEKFISARNEFIQGGIRQAMSGDVQEGVDNMKYAVDELGGSLADVSAKWAEAKNGITFEFAANKGGETLNNYVNDLMDNMEIDKSVYEEVRELPTWL